MNSEPGPPRRRSCVTELALVDWTAKSGRWRKSAPGPLLSFQVCAAKNSGQHKKTRCWWSAILGTDGQVNCNTPLAEKKPPGLAGGFSQSKSRSNWCHFMGWKVPLYVVEISLYEVTHNSKHRLNWCHFMRSKVSLYGVQMSLYGVTHTPVARTAPRRARTRHGPARHGRQSTGWAGAVIPPGAAGGTCKQYTRDRLLHALHEYPAPPHDRPRCGHPLGPAAPTAG